MRIKLFILFSIFLDFSLLSQAQQPDLLKAPNIIPPSPEAQAFQRYGEIPVDYGTGVPSIEIPLYEINTGKLKLPISITYHSSGIKVNDVSSVVGLGWRLNAGGVLTRTVLGYADDADRGIINYPFLTETQINNNSTQGTPGWSNTGSFLYTAAYGAQDAESDEYSYYAGTGLKGEFVYDNSLNITHTSFSSNKVIRHTISSAPSGYWYEVVADDGTIYLYEKRELCRLDNSPGLYPSSWWLTKIISSDGLDTIEFFYQTQTDPNVNISVSQSWTFHMGMSGFNDGGLQFGFLQTNTYQVKLTKIKFRGGAINFDYLGDRIDMQNDRIKKISIVDNGSTLIKSYNFEQSYFWSGYANDKYNYRLKLDRLEAYDAANSIVNKYSFTYNDDNILPPYLDPNSVYSSYYNPSYAIDLFGYYNGKLQNKSLIPNLPVVYDHMSGNRTTDFDYKKSCSLKKITYPTGGTTAFEYESNIDYQGKLTGGMRIKSITSSTDPISLNTASKKNYTYTNNLIYTDLDSYGSYDYSQQTAQANPAYWPSGGAWIENRTIYTDHPIVPYQQYNGGFALYQIVDEYMNDPQTNSSFKTEYTYNSEPNIVYPVQSDQYRDQYFIDRSWRRGLLAGTFYYKLVSGNYTLTKSINNEYSDFRTGTIISGIKVQPRIFLPQWMGQANWPPFSTPQPTSLMDCYYMFNTTREIGVKKLTKQHIAEFGTSSSLLSTTTYNYTSSYHLFPTSQTVTDSKGGVVKNEFKYPTDFSGSVIHQEMVSRNMISPLIEGSTFRNNNLISSIKTNYGFWNTAWTTTASGSTILPQSVDSKKGAASFESRINYDFYDEKGNIGSIYNSNDIKTLYLWGYDKTYPVAKIVGAEYNTVRNLVDQNVLDHPASDAVLQTELDNLRYGLATTKALITTYRYKPLVGMISQTDPNGLVTNYDYDAFGRLSQIRDKDNHILKKYCYNFFGQPEPCTSVGNEPQSGGFTSNCVGGGPVNYTVAANTYFAATLPEANQKAQQDVTQNGQAYADSHGSCVFYNVAMTQTFYRNCGRPLIPTPVDYTVAAGMYSASSQAAANQLAQDDINANGQAYAEIHGTCYNPTDCSSCTGPDKMCIRSRCETGLMVYTSQIYNNRTRTWTCVYHYEWSNGSWSQNYTTISSTRCY